MSSCLLLVFSPIPEGGDGHGTGPVSQVLPQQVVRPATHGDHGHGLPRLRLESRRSSQAHKRRHFRLRAHQTSSGREVSWRFCDSGPTQASNRVKFCHFRNLTPVLLDQGYVNLKNQVIKAERRVLKELGFCVHVKHPHKVFHSNISMVNPVLNDYL